jgi:hypothetical protein
MMNPILPIEILKRIAHYVEQDVSEFSLVSRQWRQAALPILFRKIYISSNDFDQREKYVEDMVSTMIHKGYYPYVKEIVLNMSILSNHEEHIHECNFTPDISATTTTTKERESVEMKRQVSAPPTSTRRRLLTKWMQGINRRNSFYLQSKSQEDLSEPQSPDGLISSVSQNPCMYKLAKSILVLFQACQQQLTSITLDFKRQPTFYMTCNSIYLFHRLLTTTYFDGLATLTVCHLVCISSKANLSPLWTWIASLNNHTLVISHCTGKFWSVELAEKAETRRHLRHIQINSMLLWDGQDGECAPHIHFPLSLRSVSIIDSPEWIHSDQSPLYQISENCHKLTRLELEVRPEASNTASFFLAQRQNSYAGFTRDKQLQNQQHVQHQIASPPLFSSYLDQAIESILVRCPSLKELTVSGFPGVTDGLFKALLLKKQKSLSRLCLSRNTGLMGSQAICSQLLELGKPIALDYIDIRQNPHLTSVFIQRIKMIHSATKINL